MRALVGPDNTILRMSNKIDPNASTKPGYRWLPVQSTEAPAVTHTQYSTFAHVVSGDIVVQEWSVGDRLRDQFIPAIKEEAQRRIVSLVGATDFQSCVVKQLNASMRATELALKRAVGGTWTAGEAAEAAALQAMADKIKAIRAASDALEVAETIPADITANEHWPA
jgi:uncharacterized coiled-coil protein SlyX